MTIPYLMNCSHSGDGWCIACVKELGEECDAHCDELKHKQAVIGELLDAAIELRARARASEDLNRRALAIIAGAITHGMPITEEVAAVRNAIVGVQPR